MAKLGVGTMRILVVDDDHVERKKLERTIRLLGHETLAASNGDEAFTIWRMEGPRIVIAKWIMPVVDGLELCHRIRAAEGSRYTYIMIMTDRDDPEDVVNTLDAGADNYITRPCSQAELKAKLSVGERIVEIESRDTVIFAISKLVESRDYETGFHLERMRHYTRLLAEYLYENNVYRGHINLNFIENIYLTSPLHDIGKVGIPDHILLKTDRLDDQEWEIMKTHTVIGYDTLMAACNHQLKTDYLQMGAEIALSHHEKWDGTGYPHGLAGNEIPLSARVVAIADVYDALVSKRVYKNAYPHEVSRAIIVNSSGKHFDPVIVEAFLACEEEFVRIHQRYGE
ncbi:MAG: response regulator [Bacillota bacterium]|jgi:putative two-component system response regulator|nr:response regulator [Bacillota bacterium]